MEERERSTRRDEEQQLERRLLRAGGGLKQRPTQELGGVRMSQMKMAAGK